MIVDPQEYKQLEREFFELTGSGTRSEMYQWIFLSLIVKEVRQLIDLLKTPVSHVEEEEG